MFSDVDSLIMDNSSITFTVLCVPFFKYLSNVYSFLNYFEIFKPNV